MILFHKGRTCPYDLIMLYSKGSLHMITQLKSLIFFSLTPVIFLFAVSFLPYGLFLNHAFWLNKGNEPRWVCPIKALVHLSGC